MSPRANICIALLALSGSALAAGPAAVNLGTSANYVILAETTITNIPGSAITGNLGLSPGTSITGFSETIDKSGRYSRSAQATGHITKADYGTPVPAALTVAVNDMLTAYNDAMGRVPPVRTDSGNGAIGGSTYAPGIFKWTGPVTAARTVAFRGSPTDTWIMQIAGTLDFSSDVRTVLSGGAVAKNIVWVVAGAVTLGTGAHLDGIVLASTNVAMQSGSSVNGRILAQTAVTLDMASVVVPPGN